MNAENNAPTLKPLVVLSPQYGRNSEVGSCSRIGITQAISRTTFRSFNRRTKPRCSLRTTTVFAHLANRVSVCGTWVSRQHRPFVPAFLPTDMPHHTTRHTMQLNESRSSYEEVTSADYHTCAVNWKGEVECWGNAHKAEQVPDGFQAA